MTRPPNQTRFDTLNKARDSRNLYTTNEQYNLTDYKFWITNLHCYTNLTPIQQNDIIKQWKNVITTGISSWNTQNYTSTTFKPNKLDISSYNGNYYLQLHVLINDTDWAWCAWIENYLEGTTYSYTDRGL